MGVHKLTAGDGYTYLTRQVAAHDSTDRGHSGLADYYSEKGESPGRWFGSGLAGVDLERGAEVTESHMRNLFGEGRHPEAERLEDAALDAGKSVEDAKKASKLGNVFARYTGNQPEFLQESAKRYVEFNREQGERWDAPVPAEIRAQIRTELAREHFEREHARAPIDERELGSFMAKATRQQTKAVAGYDLTFAPTKSVSTLWALADRDVAREVENAHHAAVEATLSWLEKEVLYTRRGRNGIQQVKTKGLLAGMFTHRDARSSDPHLHTHVAVSNKVQDETGRWLAVDGRTLFKANVTLAEMYNTRIEAELSARLGVRFEDRRRDVTDNRRPIREIVGVDERLAKAWSKRNASIEARRRELTASFQAQHGRPPTEAEAVTLSKQAWEETRQAKHSPRSESDQRAAWRDEATAILGDEQAVSAMVKQCLGHRPGAVQITDEWVDETAQRVVVRVAQDRATWQVWHLRAEAHRQARAHGVRLVELDEVVDRIVVAATTEHSMAFSDPDPLGRADTAAAQGVSIPAAVQRVENTGEGPLTVSAYSLAGSRQYTSREVLEAEQTILEAAQITGRRTISGVRVGIAVAEAVANGLQLNAAQQSLVREMATSGRSVQLALAPAGTGKTTAMEVLTRAWQDSGGTVIGLAPSAVAAQELGSSIGAAAGKSGEAVRADTLAKLVWHATNGNEPKWMQRIDASTLVLIDEAGMAATTDLAAAIAYITARGGQVRLVGDDRQLASVAAGGVLRDIAHRVGAVTLNEVHRFRNADGSINHAEAAATLALREGDFSAIAFYADQGRIHVGDLGSCADQAYAAWAKDRAADVDSILIAPTRELVAELNTRARNDRVADLSEQEIGRQVTLADGTKVSAGDRIITRKNDRTLTVSRTNWVKNGDKWTVTAVNADGSLQVRHPETDTAITLPAQYVASTVQLGYATTVHGAQGVTTGTSHVVLTGDEDRNLLYVAASRGRTANHLYLNVASDGDPHNVIRPEALIPPTALERLADILRRDGSPQSATTTLRELSDPIARLGDLAGRYHDAVTAGAESLIGPRGMAKINERAEELVPGVSDAPAWPTLRSHLALLALGHHRPLDLLRTAVDMGPMDDVRDPAAVLDARLDDLVAADTQPTSADGPRTGPLPWLPAIPEKLAQAHDWGPFTTTYDRMVREQVTAVRETARSWTSATAPPWAQPFLEDADTELRADLAVWRAVARTEANDLRPTGERTIGAPGAHQSALNRAVHQARRSYPYARRSWFQTLPECVRQDSWITPLCQRLARLERAGLPVGEFIEEALADDRPLPDEQQAAALWWRLVPHLGPAALGADAHSASLLRPSWCDELSQLVGEARAEYLQQTQAWPKIVAAVDEACETETWTPRAILSASLDAIPQDGSLVGVEVADALVLQIALLTERFGADKPHDANDAPPPPEELLPEDAKDYLEEFDRNWAEHDDGHTDWSVPPADPYAPAAPWQPADEVTAEDAFLAPGQISVERINDLNQQAMDYFASCYPRSWAPQYLSERLGTDLVGHPAHMAGYAPSSGNSLMRHLLNNGASVEELEQAGLVTLRERKDGTTYHRDFFRDRLVLPIRDPKTKAIAGFVGRRNPTKGDDDYAGPKYLNTRTTTAFTKGEALFGFAEGADALTHGALPVLVEGPMDALAITLGSDGTAVGIAPMGTALTVNQIKLLRERADMVERRDHIAVATDSDTAGWRSAQKAYWKLTSADFDPTFLELPDGSDPATLLEQHGPTALASTIVKRVPLGDAMMRALLRSSGSWADQDTRQTLIAKAARIIAVRGAETWPASINRLRSQLNLAPGILEHQTLSESITYGANPAVYAQDRIDELNAETHAQVTTPAVPAPRPGDATRTQIPTPPTESPVTPHRPAPGASR